MSSRTAQFMLVSARVKKRCICVPPISLFAIRNTIISADGILACIPGKAGRYIRAGSESVLALLSEMSGLDINVDSDKVRARVRML